MVAIVRNRAWMNWALVILAGLAGIWFGWYLTPSPPPPRIAIKAIDVHPLANAHGTLLQITTMYNNTGCDQILLARFLLNTRPVPSIALPQQQGPTVLPVTDNRIIEKLSLGFSLHEGQWHMFSVVSCYVDGEVMPDSTVSPTALFEIGA
jgi:hypothetical protein